MILSPSLLAADSGKYCQEIQNVYECGAQYLHIDCMDGHFVPNFGFNPTLVKGLRKYCPIFFDVHLMIENPEVYYQTYINAGADSITIHFENNCNFKEISDSCRQQGILFGIAVKPSTDIFSVSPLLSLIDVLLIMSIEPGFGGQKFRTMALEKIQTASRLRRKSGSSFKIAVDGGVNVPLARKIRNAGADILVAGSAIFNSSDRERNIKQLILEDL
jgi:ribulose-phosphate 3-epimerase